MKRIFTAALAAALLAGAPAMAADWPAGQMVVSGADITSAWAGADHFTGRVRMESLFPAAGDFQAYGARVTFEPGARTGTSILRGRCSSSRTARAIPRSGAGRPCVSARETWCAVRRG